eukprot:1361791-Rhodomonas_salina.2
MSGTDKAYGATAAYGRDVRLCTPSCAAMSGTDISYGATAGMPAYALAMRCPVLTYGACCYQISADLIERRAFR